MSDLPYKFTNKWFETHARTVWDSLIPQVKPTRILEVGSYEGASSCYLIEKLANEDDIEIHCIDTWGGGVEHIAASIDMLAVENRFIHNTQIAISKAKKQVKLVIHKEPSDLALSKLLALGKHGYFDLVYIDGSHQAPDVLCDAVLGFRLLRDDGVMAFDDYLWQENLPQGIDPIRCPKPAIDAFTNLYCRKLKLIKAPLYQLFIRKLYD